MCLQPKYIRPKYRWIQPESYYRVQVNCNECDQCRKARSFDYYVRSYYDYIYTTSAPFNGYVFTDCLTYANEYLPHYNGKPCFSAEDVRRFKENLEFLCVQKILERKGLKYTAHNRDTIGKPLYRKHVKTNIISEYGGDTHRPHYHTETFNRIPDILPHQLLQQCIGKAWVKEKIKKYVNWFDVPEKGIKKTHLTPIGGFDSKPSREKVLKGLGGIIYLSGYLTKDDDFTIQFEKELKNLDTKEKNKFKPRHYTYRGFGSSILNYYTPDYLLEHKIEIPAPAGSNMQHDYTSVPQYILRKIIYDKFKWYDSYETDDRKKIKTSYFFNENKATLQCASFEKKIQDVQQAIKDTINNAPKYVGDISHYKVTTLSDENIYNLSLYKYLFANRFQDTSSFQEIADIYALQSPTDALAYYREILLQRIKSNRKHISPSNNIFEHYQKINHVNTHRYIDTDKEIYLQELYQLEKEIGKQKNDKAMSDRAAKARQRNLYKKQHHYNTKPLKWYT